MNKRDYYSSQAWRHSRESKLKEQPFCMSCLCYGRNTPATDVHHIIKFYDQDDYIKEQLLTDSDNLVCLCKECHQDLHGRKKYIHPVFNDYIFKAKSFLCDKYYRNNVIIKWTNDKNK